MHTTYNINHINKDINNMYRFNKKRNPLITHSNVQQIFLFLRVRSNPGWT